MHKPETNTNGSFNPDQKTKLSFNQQEKTLYYLVDFVEWQWKYGQIPEPFHRAKKAVDMKMTMIPIIVGPFGTVPENPEPCRWAGD